MSTAKDVKGGAATSPAYISNGRPDFSPFEHDCGKIVGYRYCGNLRSELAAKTVTADQAVFLYEDMLVIRELEEMIITLRSGGYAPLTGYDYRGPTHVSIGHEATSVGTCSALTLDDNITSTHRGHGDSLARGCVAIRGMTDEQLRKRVPDVKTSSHDELLEAAIEDHVYRTITELFGKADGYCRGRGGGMHIADFTIGHLGANAIVGGGVPIATGAALAKRFLRQNGVVCCFVGDGALANGAVLESFNFASMHQFTNKLAERPFGLPVIYLVQNNHYGMTGRTDEETAGVEVLSRRAVGFSDDNMHAEVVNGMDILAVRDAVRRAVTGCKEGKGPYLVETDTYRYYGHSLSDPRHEYRTKEEEASWKEADPLTTFKKQLMEAGLLTAEKAAALEKRVKDRNARAAVRAAASPEPDAKDVMKYLYTSNTSAIVPAEFKNPPIIQPPPVAKRANSEITYRDAIREGMVEEMLRDKRVIFYGEDVADYGGAFKATKGMLETFGRDRVFNAPISEVAICGSAVGAAMLGVRPIVELMYMDFALMSSDQISNQAAKWQFMSGGHVEMPLVIRCSAGGGKGYGGQHSQTLESVFAHIPGLYVVYPSTPHDAKGMIKSAIRDNNPVMYVESQLLYGMKGPVPENDYLVPLGSAAIRREGKDITFVSWGPAIYDCFKAADKLKAESGVESEVVDIRSLVPLDIDTILRSVQKTGRCVIVSHAVRVGSFSAEISSLIQERIFDDLDAPVQRVGAKDSITPQSHVLEAAYLPSVDDILTAARSIL